MLTVADQWQWRHRPTVRLLLLLLLLQCKQTKLGAGRCTWTCIDTAATMRFDAAWGLALVRRMRRYGNCSDDDAEGATEMQEWKMREQIARMEKKQEQSAMDSQSNKLRQRRIKNKFSDISHTHANNLLALFASLVCLIWRIAIVV